MAADTNTPASKIRRFLIARHGQTNYNKEHRVQGTLDEGVILTCQGISQASSLGVYVANRQSVNSSGESTSPITRTYCSPMQRCRQTYAAVSGVCSGYVRDANNSCSSSTHVPFHPLPEPTIIEDLREIELCEWQGRLRHDVAANDSENWNTFKSHPTKLRLRDGTFAPVLDCWERAKANWETIRSESIQHDANVVFIMCHGAIGQAMLLHSLGLDIELYGKSKRFGFDNCDCFEVEWSDRDATSERWRRVYPAEGRWEKCTSTQKMYSSELASLR